MPRFSPRFVIRHPNGYYTTHRIIETKPVHLNRVLVGHDNISAPVFDGMNQMHSAQFGSRADAESLITNKDGLHGPPGCFDGCTVEENVQEQE